MFCRMSDYWLNRRGRRWRHHFRRGNNRCNRLRFHVFGFHRLSDWRSNVFHFGGFRFSDRLGGSNDLLRDRFIGIVNQLRLGCNRGGNRFRMGGFNGNRLRRADRRLRLDNLRLSRSFLRNVRLFSRSGNR
jgi:hypothetical protein